MTRVRNHVLPSKGCLAGLCLVYAVTMLYSSTIIGPTGVNFVYRDPVEAFWFFLGTPYVAHGSDQRADWMGNLLMLVPFGFLVTGLVWPRRAVARLPAALCAILICIAIILTIKYLQLFFPPRTVTLNYIVAQTLGAVIGCAGCAAWIEGINRSATSSDVVASFVLALWLYSAALFLFVLMPLDFALDWADLWAQIERVPDTLLALPGSGQSPAVRVILIAVAAAAFVPVGVLLTFVRNGVYQVRRTLPSIAGRGLLITTGLYCLAALVMSASPVVPSILYRTGGIVAGAAAVHWLARQDPGLLLQRLRGLVPWAVCPYLVCVLLVNHLFSTHWLSVSQSVAHAYPLGLLPLFDYYIVTKAQAAKNIVGHAVLYMPVGVLLWLRQASPAPGWESSGRRVGGLAFVMAALLSFLVELARYMRPGLEGDINAVAVAGLASMLAARSMPLVWSMVKALGCQSRYLRPDVGRPSS